MFRGSYQHIHATDDALAWCQAANLLLPPGAALSHRSAALLHGVDLLGYGVQPTMEVTVPPPSRLRPDARLIVHRTRLPPADVVRRGGLPVTTPARTAFDLGRDPDRVAAVVALDALLHHRVIRPGALRAIADERLGWPGVVAFRAAASLARARRRVTDGDEVAPTAGGRRLARTGPPARGVRRGRLAHREAGPRIP
jgi:hypothetical protein